MPIYINTLPQNTEPIKTTTLHDLISILPDEIPFKQNVWIAGKIVRYGITIENLIFLIEQDVIPTIEQRQYFSSIVKPLGISATCINNWNDETFLAMQIYSEGVLMVDKDTLSYKMLPMKRPELPKITVQEVLDKLPKIIDYKGMIYLTGSLVKAGWSCNDVDFKIEGKVEDTKIFATLIKIFNTALGWKVHVGNAPMEEREPIYLFKIYEEGKLWGT